MSDRPSAAQEQQLMTEIWDPKIADNPLAFVLFAFPWGKANTPLHDQYGPRGWQREELEAMAAHIAEQKQRIHIRDEKRRELRLTLKGVDLEKALEPFQPRVYKSATVSGRGTGKSAFVAWINLWMMSTRIGSTAIVTANTEAQLKSKTWAELGKWHTLAINSHWFEKMALSLKPAQWFEKELKRQLKLDTGYYYAQAELWSEEKPDSFAGVHNHKGVIVTFDEASGIPKPIWTVTEGFFTEPVLDRYHFVFSNGRRNTGPFFECFHRHRNFWRRRHLDSRTVEGTDRAQLNQIVAQHGEDSDEARVEVRGLFPRQGDKQFISREVVDQATTRELVADDHAALMMGVDPARYGDDASVIWFRQGRNAKVIPPIVMRGADNMEVANRCAELITKFNPDAVCIDVGNGSGVIDRLREMGYKVHEVGFGTKSPKDEYANMRTFLWGELRDWLRGGCIPDDQELIDDLTSPEYKFQGSSDKIMLESKEQLKGRGFSSPDKADALACTFAVKVARKDLTASRNNPNKRAGVVRGMDYAIFG